MNRSHTSHDAAAVTLDGASPQLPVQPLIGGGGEPTDILTFEEISSGPRPDPHHFSNTDAPERDRHSCRRSAAVRLPTLDLSPLLTTGRRSKVPIFAAGGLISTSTLPMHKALKSTLSAVHSSQPKNMMSDGRFSHALNSASVEHLRNRPKDICSGVR